MKQFSIFLIISIMMLSVSAQTQSKETISNTPDPAQKIIIVEASCGECQFGLPGKGCDLAVRMNGHAYYVDGTNIHSHGDAHADDGFCLAISKAEVQGKVVNGRFQASYFKVIKEKDPTKVVK